MKADIIVSLHEKSNGSYNYNTVKMNTYNANCKGNTLESLNTVSCRQEIADGKLDKINNYCRSLYNNLKERNLTLDDIPYEFRNVCACHMPDEYYDKLRQSVEKDLDNDANLFLQLFGINNKDRSMWYKSCKESTFKSHESNKKSLDIDLCWNEETPEEINRCVKEKINNYCRYNEDDETCRQFHERRPCIGNFNGQERVNGKRTVEQINDIPMSLREEALRTNDDLPPPPSEEDTTSSDSVDDDKSKGGKKGSSKGKKKGSSNNKGKSYGYIPIVILGALLLALIGYYGYQFMNPPVKEEKSVEKVTCETMSFI